MRTGEGGARTPGKAEIYRCFLVRCRLEGNGSPAWRFTVQQAGEGGARHSFTCFDDVAAHMRAELASCGAPAGDDTTSTPIARAVTQDRPYHGTATQDRPYNGTTAQDRPYHGTAAEDRPYNGAEEHAQTVRRQEE